MSTVRSQSGDYQRSTELSGNWPVVGGTPADDVRSVTDAVDVGYSMFKIISIICGGLKFVGVALG